MLNKSKVQYMFYREVNIIPYIRSFHIAYNLLHKQYIIMQYHHIQNMEIHNQSINHQHHIIQKDNQQHIYSNYLVKIHPNINNFYLLHQQDV
jgi:hypothetical protein